MFNSDYIKNIDGIEILDGDTFVGLKGILKNNDVSNWLLISLSNGATCEVTSDHPFITDNGKTIASDLLIGDCLYYNDEEVEISDIKPLDCCKPSYDVETESGMFTFSNIKSSNCRTANLSDINADAGVNSQIKDGRGNCCPVTIILPTLAMEAKELANNTNNSYPYQNILIESFMDMLDTKIHEAKDMLIERYNWICSQPVSAAKFMYQNNLGIGFDGKTVESVMKHFTLAVGQIGLAECLQILIGKDHTTEEGMELAKRIEQLFKTRCAEFKKEYKLNFGVYYTPAEGLSHTSLKKFREKYGVIENVSDKEFFTNSMHVPVWKEMSPFDKIDIESQLTGYSSAGCITYVELDSGISNNTQALEQIVNYAMDKDIPYFAINVPVDECNDCGYSGEFDDICPECGGQNVGHLRRVTGYLTGDYKSAFNPGKVDEVEHRVRHGNYLE